MSGSIQPPIAGLDDEGRLTPVAKFAILKYLWLLVIPPAGLAALLAGIGGVFVSKVFFESGYIAGQTEGIKAGITALADAANKAGEAQAEAKQAKDAAVSALRETEKENALARVSAEDAQKTAQQAHETLSKDYDRLAQLLARTPTFQNAAETTLNPAVASQDSRISALQTELNQLLRLEVREIEVDPGKCDKPNDSSMRCPLPRPANRGHIRAALLAPDGPIPHQYVIWHIEYGDDGGAAWFAMTAPGGIKGAVPRKIRLVLVR